MRITNVSACAVDLPVKEGSYMSVSNDVGLGVTPVWDVLGEAIFTI